MSTQITSTGPASRRLVVGSLIAICAIGAVATLDSVRRSILDNGLFDIPREPLVSDTSPRLDGPASGIAERHGEAPMDGPAANGNMPTLAETAPDVMTLPELTDLGNATLAGFTLEEPASTSELASGYGGTNKSDQLSPEVDAHELKLDVQQPSLTSWPVAYQQQGGGGAESPALGNVRQNGGIPKPNRVALTTTSTSNSAAQGDANNGSPEIVPSPLPIAQNKPEEMTIAGVAAGLHDVFGLTLASGVQGGYERSWATSLASRRLSVALEDYGSQQAYSESAATAKGAGGRVWLGIRSGERGIKISYWSLESNSHPEDVNHSSFEPITFRGSTYLHASAFDIEIDQPFCVYGVEMAVTTGARYVTYDLSDAVFGLGKVQKDINLSSYAGAIREMTAMGFTTSLSGRYPLNLNRFWTAQPANAAEECCDVTCCIPAWVFWNVRTAAVWGEARAEALTEATATLQTSDGRTAFAASRDYAVSNSESNELQGQFELQIGLETRRMFAYLPGEWVIRGGLEYRRWELGDAFASTESYAFLADEAKDFGGQASAVASTNDDKLELFALVFSFGVNY